MQVAARRRSPRVQVAATPRPNQDKVRQLPLPPCRVFSQVERSTVHRRYLYSRRNGCRIGLFMPRKRCASDKDWRPAIAVRNHSGERPRLAQNLYEIGASFQTLLETLKGHTAVLIGFSRGHGGKSAGIASSVLACPCRDLTPSPGFRGVTQMSSADRRCTAHKPLSIVSKSFFI